MANETVTLLRHAKFPGLGWRRGKAIIGKNGKVNPDHMLLGKRNNKRKVHAPEGHFELCVTGDYNEGLKSLTNATD